MRDHQTSSVLVGYLPLSHPRHDDDKHTHTHTHMHAHTCTQYVTSITTCLHVVYTHFCTYVCRHSHTHTQIIIRRHHTQPHRPLPIQRHTHTHTHTHSYLALVTSRVSLNRKRCLSWVCRPVFSWAWPWSRKVRSGHARYDWISRHVSGHTGTW